MPQMAAGLNAVALRTAAQVYAPWHIVWEMDGPLDVTLGNGPAVQASWKSLQSSLQLKLGDWTAPRWLPTA